MADLVMLIDRVGTDCRREQRWRNGGGSTIELFRAEIAGELVCRLSVATVQQSGAFSVFKNIQRHLFLLEGVGLVLDFGVGKLLSVNEPYVPIVFDGDLPVNCRLLAGSVRVVNLMTDRRRVSRTRVQVLASADRFQATDMTLLYPLRGAWHVAAEGEQVERLSENEVSMIRGQNGQQFVLSGAGQILKADLSSAR